VPFAVAVAIFLLCLAIVTLCGTYRPSIIPWLAQPVLLIGFAIVVQTATQADFPKSRLLEWLGDRSYSIYLLHFPVMALFWAAVLWSCSWLFYINPIWYGLAQAICCLTATFLLSDLSFSWIEQPFNRIGAVLLKPRKRSASLDTLPSAVLSESHRPG
jgi:peptidoglycan/LPS O-acetylase OafA/YrhL